MKNMNGALDGIRVLDASQMLAGPICAMRLGDLGADVLKIEPPHGEHNRHNGFGAVRVSGSTPTFVGLNRNKRSVTIDLKQPSGLAALLELVAQADVFLQNYRVGTAERLGIGWEQLRAVNPRLVYAQITGYGEEGPWRDRPGQDLLVQAMSGSMWAVGSEDDPPQPSALWAADAMTGYQTAIGVLAALHARERSGEGQKVSVSMLGAVMDCQVQELATHLNSDASFERTKEPSAHSWIPAPYGVFRTSDSWLALAMAPLATLGEALDEARLSELTGADDGVVHRDEIHALVARRLHERTTEEWVAFFDERRLWSGPVAHYDDLVTHPQVEATDMIVSIDDADGHEIRLPAPPVRLSGTPSSVRLAPPRLGADNEQVMTEWLSWSDVQIQQARASGAFGEPKSEEGA